MTPSFVKSPVGPRITGCGRRVRRLILVCGGLPLLPAAGLLLIAVASTSVEAATFEDTGGTLGGETLSLEGISGDGATLVGRASGAVPRAGRWRPGGLGWLNLGTIPGNTSTNARAVNFDGSVIVGNGDVSFGMRFVEGGDWEALNLPNDGAAQAVSADGSIVGGDYIQGSGPFFLSGLVLWKEGAGSTTYLPAVGLPSPSMEDLTGDGTVMLATRSFLYGTDIARVTDDGSVTFPSTEPQNGVCQPCAAKAEAISSDGSTIVGGLSLDAFANQPLQAARWFGTQAPLLLGFLDPPAADPTSLALDVSADGSVVVGESDGRAFIWTEAHGMRDMKQVLEATGLDLAGWALTSASAVSDDGSVIAGAGTNPAGNPSIWRVVAPELSAPPFSVPGLDPPHLVGLAGLLAALGIWTSRRLRRASQS